MLTYLSKEEFEEKLIMCKLSGEPIIFSLIRKDSKEPRWFAINQDFKVYVFGINGTFALSYFTLNDIEAVMRFPSGVIKSPDVWYLNSIEENT